MRPHGASRHPAPMPLRLPYPGRAGVIYVRLASKGVGSIRPGRAGLGSMDAWSIGLESIGAGVPGAWNTSDIGNAT